MASVFHGSARTTPTVRAELQAAQASSRANGAQCGINLKTVLKWRNRDTTADAAMGPKPRSSVLTKAEKAIVVEFRRRTLLPLDDVLERTGSSRVGGFRRELKSDPSFWLVWRPAADAEALLV